jgi:hypothetical protein
LVSFQLVREYEPLGENIDRVSAMVFVHLLGGRHQRKDARPMAIARKAAGAAAGIALVTGFAAHQPAMADARPGVEEEAIPEISFLLPAVAALVWALNKASKDNRQPVSP